MASATKKAPARIEDIKSLDQVSRDMLLAFAITEIKREGRVASYENVIAWFEQRKLARGEYTSKQLVSVSEDILVDQGLLDTRYVKVGNVNVPELQLSHHADKLWDVLYDRLHGLPAH